MDIPKHHGFDQVIDFTENAFSRQTGSRQRLADYLKRLDEDDATEAGTSGSRTKNLAEKIEALRTKRGRYGALLNDLERGGEDQISLTDPDSRAMAAHTKVGGGYNIQIAVDAKNKMIVEQAVSNQVVDMGLLTQTAEAARDGSMTKCGAAQATSTGIQSPAFGAPHTLSCSPGELGNRAAQTRLYAAAAMAWRGWLSSSLAKIRALLKTLKRETCYMESNVIQRSCAIS